MHPSTYKAKAYSAASETASLASTTIPRRDPTDRDVQIEILFCGICHSDLHSVRNEWSEFMATNYPIVPEAYSAASETSPLTSTTIPRRDPTERDVQIEILFCGICHSDLHSVRNEWSEFMATNYPNRSRSRDRRPCNQGRFGRYQVQGRRSRRGWLHGRLRPHLPKLQT